MKLSVKLFLEDQGRYVLGPGRMRLLHSVETLGSLHKAAQELGMSYRWAWGRLNDMEKFLGIRLLAHAPGSGGKAKTLTGEARDLLAWYDSVEKDMAEVLDKAVDRLPAFTRMSAFDPEAGNTVPKRPEK